ncbi:hypothetical protein LOZ51_003717 [Ophidiomyces ophidiicola]|nr:hypothetical protein LOZ55_001715 [Ophidiomyces ophidiicola]KAI1991736.1 hypothetical protein LOZ54_001983 [Ophidiomyces ophidiicola]KAI1994524.1 hypothetical protein LOZ51_003717 [Ophidiomyces ophidiicola]
MASPLQPLELFQQRYPSMAFSPHAPSTHDAKANGLAQPSGVGVAPRSILNIVAPHISEAAAPRTEAPASSIAPKTRASSVLLQTSFGLQLNIDDKLDGSGIIAIQNMKLQKSHLQEAPIPNAFRYRLLPEWRTSFLWYDPLWPQNPPGETHVDEDVITARYPDLAASYFTWKDAFEESFEQQRCHLGSGSEPFADDLQRVAWEVGGFLIACWLACQDDVDGVTYLVSAGTYEIGKADVELVLQRFLVDMNGLI